jgi:hypothetical protein
MNRTEDSTDGDFSTFDSVIPGMLAPSATPASHTEEDEDLTSRAVDEEMDMGIVDEMAVAGRAASITKAISRWTKVRFGSFKLPILPFLPENGNFKLSSGIAILVPIQPGLSCFK